MSELFKLTELRKLLLDMEHSMGLQDLSTVERDIYYAASDHTASQHAAQQHAASARSTSARSTNVHSTGAQSSSAHPTGQPSPPSCAVTDPLKAPASKTGAVKTTALQEHALLANVSRPTFFRALKSLQGKGYLEQCKDSVRGYYIVKTPVR